MVLIFEGRANMVEKWEDVFSINFLIHLTELKRRLSSTDISLTIDFVYWWVLYPCYHSRNRPVFCSFPSAKTCPFSCRVKRAFPSGETLILPASRASRYNTLHFASKVVCQRDTLWKPYFAGVCSHTSSRMQNKRHRPARSRCWSMPPICLYGCLLYRPY